MTRVNTLIGNNEYLWLIYGKFMENLWLPYQMQLCKKRKAVFIALL